MDPVALRFRVAGIPVKLNLQFKLAAADWETTQNAITPRAGSAPHAVRLTIGQLDRLDNVMDLLGWRVAGFVVHRDLVLCSRTTKRRPWISRDGNLLTQSAASWLAFLYR